MNGEIIGLQRRLRHLYPQKKYINCQNHWLALVFMHLTKDFKGLRDMDQLLLNLWKMFNYSSVKFSVFEKAQELEGLTPLKTLKCPSTRWLSHGAATQRIISGFSLLVDALDTIYFKKHDAEVKGVLDLFLRSNVILFLLLLVDVLMHVNRFPCFLQSRSCLHNSTKETVWVNQQFRKVEKWRRVLYEATWEKLLADFEGKTGIVMTDLSTWQRSSCKYR